MSIIAAGTTTTTALSSTGNTDGTLQLQVNGTTPSVTLNTLGAVGVGSTPAFGTSGQVLTSAGSTAAPSWTSVTSSQWVTTGSNIYYNTGNVGIGTSSPATKLDVSAASGINAIRVNNTSTDTTSYAAQSYFRVDAGGNHIGGLKSTVRNLGGLSTPSLYLTTSGAYPIAFGINDSATPTMVFDASSNLGLGVVPFAWSTNGNFDQKFYTSINTWDDGFKAVFQSGNNYYQSGSTFYYKATTEASFYRQRAGVHSFHSAPSGAAGSAITFSQVFGVTASGAIGVGSTPSYGTSGQVLTSGGSGAAPTWSTPSAGAMTLLATVTASNSATVDFNNTYITSTYSSYVVMFSGWTPSVDRPIYTFRVSSNNLASNLSCEYCVTRVDSASVSIRANTTSSGIDLVTPGTFSTSVDNGGASGSLYIYNPSSTSTGKTIEWFLGGYSTNSGSQEIWNGTATYRTAATAINSIRFQVSGGNIATGVFKLYGIQ
jgi:hypothetical protein